MGANAIQKYFINENAIEIVYKLLSLWLGLNALTGNTIGKGYIPQRGIIVDIWIWIKKAQWNC